MKTKLIGCAICLLVLVKSGNAVSWREENKQEKVIGAGNCTYDMDCPGDHPCCVLEDKETVCGQCTSYYKGVCMRCDTSQIVDAGERKGSEPVNDQLRGNCTKDQDCPGDQAPFGGCHSMWDMRGVPHGLLYKVPPSRGSFCNAPGSICSTFVLMDSSVLLLLLSDNTPCSNTISNDSAVFLDPRP